MTDTLQCAFYNDCNHKDCNELFCMRKYKLSALYQYSLLPEARYERKTLYVDKDEKTSDLEAFKQLASIEKNIMPFVTEGENLYLYSPKTGNGKTSWSIRLLQAYLNKIWPKSDLVCKALFVNVSDFFRRLKENISVWNEEANYIKDNIIAADLVIWDDICTKVGSEYELSYLFSFIDTRLTMGKSNIYTSNVSPKEFASFLGDRLASRVVNSSQIIMFKGDDKRPLEQKMSEVN